MSFTKNERANYLVDVFLLELEHALVVSVFLAYYGHVAAAVGRSLHRYLETGLVVDAVWHCKSPITLDGRKESFFQSEKNDDK